ncbi:MAG: hypothetical protein E7410_06920 [Ruminococcaceae bacterium]|nr:hypothetical protein [Oscillospiraceae bacterium]
MLRINNIKVNIDSFANEYLYSSACSALNISQDKIKSLKLVKKSIDARKKNDVHYVCSVDVALDCDEDSVLKLLEQKHKAANIAANIKKLVPSSFELAKPRRLPDVRPVVCGFGPAGMFCALMLARAGFRPIVLERGGDVDSRTEAVERFFKTGIFSENTNVQFGEGGAGTFSDGKLTCGINDERMSYILSQLVHFGADEDIMYMAKPHIGTDVLRRVVKNLRKEIESFGGEVRFNTKLCDIKTDADTLKAVVCQTSDGEYELLCDTLIMAIGHSARDTFSLLYEKGLELLQKPFSIGVRIEHLQSMINQSQYGEKYKNGEIGAADYKLSCKTGDGRGVYTFCMCPGGSVVAAASESGGVVTNGMSLRARDGKNANAALLCDVRTSDFRSEHPLAGIEFQRIWEQKAYILGQKSYKAPANLVGDFLQKCVSSSFGSVLPTYMPGVIFASLDECLPDFVCNAFREAIPMLDSRMRGFASADAVMTGVETRSSSPVRIVRNEKYESVKKGIFPCGEGAGYAGGIMSAALDGIKVACEIIGRFE